MRRAAKSGVTQPLRYPEDSRLLQYTLTRRQVSISLGRIALS